MLGTLAVSTHGACLVLPAETFEPLAVLDSIQAERCTSLYGVPTMFVMELEDGRFADFDLSSLRTGIDGRRALPRRSYAQRPGAHAPDGDHHHAAV